MQEFILNKYLQVITYDFKPESLRDLLMFRNCEAFKQEVKSKRW
jgi:predicted solute-binding protein